VSRTLRLPFAASIAGHCCVLAVLILLAGQLQPLVLQPPTSGIEIMLAPQPVAAAPEPPPPVVEAEPPPPEPPPPPPEPPPPAVTPQPLPPPPPPRPVAKPVPRRPATVAPTAAPVETAAIPQSVAPAVRTAPVVSPAYAQMLSAWLESHKRYPEDARERGEEGRGVLRFRVERSGHLLNFALVQSTGHPELDAAINEMLQGATLPPFPPDMAASEIEVSVPIRYTLAR